MAVDDTYVQGDTGPDIEALLRNIRTKQPIDLTGATVMFQMRKPDDRRYQVNAECDIVDDPVDGVVTYSWGPNDLSVSGLYQAQFEVTYPEGTEITTKVPLMIEVRRQ